ncbi:hypothetical protein P1J78_04875 [Psychromarinibacter sp. C21-152]|uniref:Thioredoxin domain-containing protein n=1 Tax=Psychromarinibacter sediminicola TaxID=3033385 RepID=A0AAE3NR00_9RHOB|nr:hypothetical protein [Psychromarinibacter sediminicola]MDF0600059.1 hypothetical protein [Psychromarinibacter sediminicola]
MRLLRLALPLLLAAAPVAPAWAQDTLERLRDLRPDPPSVGAIYAEEIAADLALIAAQAERLFDPDRPGLGPADAPVRIAFFTGAGCTDCPRARAELAALAARLGVRAAVFDVSDSPADAALMDRLTLDTLPSYVMRDGLIRGAMPAMVLERYLTSE